MASVNYKHTYTSSADVVAVCVKRRSAFNVFNKVLGKPNESADFARAQMLQRNGLGGTTQITPNTVKTVLLPLTNRF